MKTINALSASMSILGQNPSSFFLNEFEYVGNYTSELGLFEDYKFRFNLNCCPRHFQRLKLMGVEIQFSKIYNKAKTNDNTLIVQAYAPLRVLESLEKYSRDNHLNSISIHNDYELAKAGWKFHHKPATVVNIDLFNHLSSIEGIHKMVRKISKKVITPYQKNCQTKLKVSR